MCNRMIATFLTLAMTTFVAGAEPKDEKPVETAPRLWQRLEPTLPPLEWKIEKDEVVPSDTDPRRKLRRVEVKFHSQELDGRKLGHPCVVFMPADPKDYNAPSRRGKVVIVGQRGWDGLATGPWRNSFLGNYGEPIASRTGYPTMICPVPGEYDEAPGQEASMGGFHNRFGKDSQDMIDHPHVRVAVIYLRAMDVMAGVLGIEPEEIRSVIGGHSKRATPAHTAASMDPRVRGVVYMGNESYWTDAHLAGPHRAAFPPYAQRWTDAKVLYIGGTNEDGYSIYDINRIVERMDPPWTVEIIPNYRHASQSEKHPLDWMMWIAHVFEGRPITTIGDMSHEPVGADFVWGGRKYGPGTLFRAKIDSPNKIIQMKVWYVYNDDEPYWR
ncbi:MAG: hypothetical protein JW809_04035, partial [Pirellulales bacterium]|nr:hypothetical protein [Pirellulales bacterium]